MNERSLRAALGAAGPVAAPVQVARPDALVRQTVRVRDGRHERAALCELDPAGIRITGPEVSRTIPWRDARSISVDRGRILIVSPAGSLAVVLVLDGVSEPELAPPFARVLEAGRAGTLGTSTGARHELALGIDRALERFGDADDPVVPIAIAIFSALAGLVLVAAIPAILQLAAHVQPGPGAFAVMPRIAIFDPRTIVAGLGSASALAVAVGRVALGPSATVWARGTLRGWHRNAYGVEAAARRAIARLMLAPRAAAIAAAIAIGTLVPSAFARAVVDQAGIHEASGLPFLARDRPWAEVTEVVPVAVGFAERAEGFATTLVFSDGSDLSTRGRDLAGGSERAFYDFARAHAR
ncbi:MAG TPA: hypothetical protein VGT60_04420 [Candidatus Limnocylindria bacterium]|nr:hypothetical protein [Candidatus Limnocylindria bacterium]